MDERDFKALNKLKKEEIHIKHDPKVICFSMLQSGDLYNYYFYLINGKIILHSIDIFKRNGKTGNTYKREEIFHHEYKKTVYNSVSEKFEDPKVPEQVLKDAYSWRKGILINKL